MPIESILTRLRDNRMVLDSIAEALVEKQELSGKELRELASSQGGVSASGGG